MTATKTAEVAPSSENEKLLSRKAAAQARIQAACEHLENAQQEIGRAEAALSALCFMFPEQKRMSKLYAKVKDQFYRLSARSYAQAKACAKAELDREPTDGEHGHRGCCNRSGMAVRS